ncbi:DUF1499 domain-containing protein [Gemmobacter caeruleus]|uniref:DUF1499 domain-containing protein n=1 Tax=Gemmobacter caeruleus TaxID=2595004 RepID=UPI0011EBFA8D|nr:DUF1499 domain-containing protein [Gemmobacter caeruleus]
MKWIALVTFGLPLLAALCFSAFVRLAPVDPARWHVTLADHPASIKPNDATAYAEGGDLAAPILPDRPEAVLERLAAIALAEPRSRLIAGTPAEGRITLMQRSALWGMPDFITAEARATPQGTRLEIWSRARFGFSDFGTNRARLERWIAGLRG